MRRIQRLSCGSVSAAQRGTRSCDLRDLGPTPAMLVNLQSCGENAWAWGRRRYCADKQGQVVRRLAQCGCVRRVIADERAWLVSGYARAGGNARPAELAGPVEAGWAELLPPSFLFHSSFSFVFLFFICFKLIWSLNYIASHTYTWYM